jgi:hypothetical protein
MSKGGYNKLLQKLQEALADNLRLRSQIMERDQKLAVPPPAPSDKAGSPAPQKSNKVKEFWTSTPVWGAISMVLTLVVSALSVKVIYFAAWVIFCFEFVRIRIVENRGWRYALNIWFCAVLGIGFIAIGSRLHPLESQSLDQNIDQLADRLGQRFPLLQGAAYPVTQIFKEVEQQAPPDLRPKIESVTVGPRGPSDTSAIVVFDLVDRGGPSNLIGASLTLKMDGTTYDAVTPVSPTANQNVTLRNPMHPDEPLMLPGSAYWSNVVGSKALATNLSVIIWTAGLFEGVPEKHMVDSRAVLTLTCVDALHRNSTSEWKFTGQEKEFITLQDLATQPLK